MSKIKQKRKLSRPLDDYQEGADFSEGTYDPHTTNDVKGKSIETPGKPLNLKGLGQTTGKLVPYLSNIVNSFRTLPLPSAAQQESYINPNLVNYDATRARIQNNLANFNRETDYRVAGRTLAQGLKAKALAGATEGLNDAAQAEANTNAMIKNQTAQFNQGTQARNLERLQNYNDALLARSLKQQEFNAENLANIGDKYQMQTRDQNMYDLEKRKLGIIPKFYENGTYQRNLSDEQAAAEEAQSRKFGGTTYQFGGNTPDDGQEDYKLRTQLFKERQAKRDSVRESLYAKYPHNFNKANQGMLDYYETEPAHYKNLDVTAYRKTLHPFGGEAGPGTPYTVVPWSKQGVTSADTLARGTMYKMPYSLQSKLYKTPIPAGTDPNADAYITTKTNPGILMQRLSIAGKPTTFNTVTGTAVPHNQMGTNVGGLKYGGLDYATVLDDHNFENSLPTIEEEIQMKYGGIHIKPSHRGRFTAWKARTGKTTEEALHSSNPAVRKMANFARNAAKWHHKFGGQRMEGWDQELENAGAEQNMTLLGSSASDANSIGSRKFKRLFGR